MYEFVYILINYKLLYNTIFNLFIFIIVLNRQRSNLNRQNLNEALKKIELK